MEKQQLHDLISDTFKDLVEKWDFKIHFRSKMTFSFHVLEDLPFELKADIYNRVKFISESFGRKSFTVENPTVKTVAGKTIITSGIWHIRIY